tara:strand:+ start:1955 stop:2212 length:258 start_codon:yes stop_codon:yes gene_type:complete
MTYTVIIKPSAVKAGKKLPKEYRRKIFDAINDLEKNPLPNGCKKVIGMVQTYRIRVGKYCIIYKIEKGELLILVIKIAHRSQAYR